jgi:uncharacterized protein YecE (DUF72 family)
MPPRYYIGTSGWHYEHWRGRFYPQKLAKAEWFSFYCGRFSTVEINSSFYRLPTEETFTSWRDASPAGFVFAVKVSRFITHVRQLKGCAEAVSNFLARAERLGDKLGPLLYQLPPNMPKNEEVLAQFLASLPAGKKHVLEFRHESWLEDAVFDMLRQYGVGFCIFDMPSVRCPLVTTTDFAYLRFHGSTGLYASCYSDEELASWAEKLSRLAVGLKEMYLYFSNDAEAFAVQNALTLHRYLASE